MPAADTTQFHHPDRLGTRLVTNGADGAVVSEQVGQPYGTMLANGVLHGEGSYQDPNANRSNQSPKRFTSYDRSATTGLDYAVNRFYNSAQGRFTQVDPIEMNAASLEDPQTLNLYSYCGNDPINHVDPDGLFFKRLFNAINKFFSNIWVKIAVVVALSVISFGASAGWWSLFNTIAIPGTAAVANAGPTLLGWITAGLAAVSGISLPGWVGGYGGFSTPPISGGFGSSLADSFQVNLTQSGSKTGSIIPLGPIARFVAAVSRRIGGRTGGKSGRVGSWLTRRILGTRHIEHYDPRHVLQDPNKFAHIFNPKHKLSRLGDEIDALGAITKEVFQADRLGLLPRAGDFEVGVLVRGHTVIVRGAIVNGELRYGTIFIP